MSQELTTQFPWELAPRTTEDVVTALQRDFAYAVANTAVTVHSNNPLFAFTVNTPRGQLVPRNECKFTDGTTIELSDIGMCQPGNMPYMTVPELLEYIFQLATEQGLGLVK